MGYLILIGWLVLLPVCVGGVFFSHKEAWSLGGLWFKGQFLLWAVFQVMTVPFIIAERNIRELQPLYVRGGLILGLFGLVCVGTGMWKRVHKSKGSTSPLWINKKNHIKDEATLWTREQKVMAIIFALLWLVQMFMLVFGAVNDGDDAYYMAVAETADYSGVMYVANVYAFGAVDLNYRYILAPFPIWIAFLARISGVHTLTIGHIVLGIVLVTMSYVLYAHMGKVLFGEDRRKRLQMLIWVAILFVWGNTSSHTAESFLLLRSRQGKALVAGIVFPAMIYLLLKLGRALEKKERITFRDYLLGMAIILTGCLGSTLGGALVILLWGSALLFLTIGYRKWSLLPFGIFSAMPGLVYTMLYLLK